MVHSITATSTLRSKDTPKSALRTIEEAKARVPVEDLAAKHTELHRSGDGLRGPCPVHKGDNPEAFSVSPDKGLWHCFSCGEGGDVVELYQRLHGHQDAKTAAAMLLMEFGHEPPQRPDAWFCKQERQRPVRDKLDEARTNLLHRRLFRRFCEPLLEGVEDPEQRDEDAQILWEALGPIAEKMREGLMGRGGGA